MKLCDLICDIEYFTKNKGIDNIEIDRLCYDSRKAQTNSLFVCLKGVRSDGHAYVNNAYELGCRCFIAQDKVSLPQDAVVLYTDDTRIALAKVSAAFFNYPSGRLMLIGVTGTKGKTSTSLMIADVMNKNGIRTGYIGSNGVIFDDFFCETVNTTPESYELNYYFDKMLSAGIKVAVVEVSSQALYLNRVCSLTFDYCIFTNLSEDHIGGCEHPTFEHYKACKMSLLTNYGAHTIIYNADDDTAAEIQEITKGKRQFTFGISNESADYKARNIRLARRDYCLGVDFECVHGDTVQEVSLCTPGKFSVSNALAAITLCSCLGIDIKQSSMALKNAKIKGRFEVIRSLPGIPVVIDYAHNKVSMREALNALREYKPNRIICVFGSVGNRTFIRRQELGEVVSELADLAVITSDNPGTEPPEEIIDDIAVTFLTGKCPFVKITDRTDAIDYALNEAKTGDIVLLAGKGHETYQLIGYRKVPFSELDIVEKVAEEILDKQSELILDI